MTFTDGHHYIDYDETLAEAMARHLRLKAAWQNNALSQTSPDTIVLIDEPSLTTLGTSFVPLSTGI